MMERLFTVFANEGVDFKRFNQSDLEKVMEICETKNCIIWINNSSSITPTFINDYGKEYYGFEHKDLSEYGFGLYEKFIHPDHFEDVRKTIVYFGKNHNELHRMTYLVRNSEGQWRWTYSIAKPLNYKENGNPEYVLAIVFDIESMLEEISGGKLETEIGAETASMLKRFKKLTKREKQIMRLIADEHTSHEIAEKLFIEPSTVDTHRKHIISKLGVKNSMGLVQYALKFPPKK